MTEEKERREIMREFFSELDEDKQSLAYDAIDEYLFFLNQYHELKKLPLIRVDSKNPAKQQLTPAAKLIKECSNVIDAKRNLLLRVLYREQAGAADELLAKLAEFE